jgi:hypothetical protein
MNGGNILKTKINRIMKVVSGIIMIIGLGIGFYYTSISTGVPQYLQSLVPMIGGYILGRALETMSEQK